MALGGLIPVSLEIVVKLNLTIGWDIFGCKEPDLQLALDHPFLRLGVGFTAMVDEACSVAFPACVNHLHKL